MTSESPRQFGYNHITTESVDRHTFLEAFQMNCPYSDCGHDDTIWAYTTVESPARAKTVSPRVRRSEENPARQMKCDASDRRQRGLGQADEEAIRDSTNFVWMAGDLAQKDYSTRRRTCRTIEYATG